MLSFIKLISISFKISIKKKLNIFTIKFDKYSEHSWFKLLFQTIKIVRGEFWFTILSQSNLKPLFWILLLLKSELINQLSID